MNILRYHRARRAGRDDPLVRTLIEERVGRDIDPDDLTPEDVRRIVREVTDACADEPAALPWLSGVVCEPEDPELVPQIVRVLDVLWDDPRIQLANPLLPTLGFLLDQAPEAREVLERWATRDDYAGEEARDALSMDEPAAWTSVDELIETARDAITRGATFAPAIKALNELLRNASEDTSSSDDRYVIDVEAVLARVAQPPPGRRPVQALVAVLDGVRSPAAVPHLIAALTRIEETAATPGDRYDAPPLLKTLSDAPLPENVIDDLLSRWADVYPPD